MESEKNLTYPRIYYLHTDLLFSLFLFIFLLNLLHDKFIFLIGKFDVGSRCMDKLDFCLIPFVYLFWMTFSILSLALFLALYFPTIVTKALQNTAIWIALTCIHLILFTLSALYRLVQIRPIQFILNLFQQSSVIYTILSWPRFCYSKIIIKEKRRYLWEILKNPVPPYGPKSDKRVVTLWQQGGIYHLMRNKIVCLNQNMECKRTSTKRYVMILMKH